MFDSIDFPLEEWIHVYCNAGLSPYPLLSDADKIIEEINLNPNRNKIIFMAHGDGFTVHFNTFSEIARRIMNGTGIPLENIAIVIGSQCTKETIELYKKYIEEYNWLPIRLVLSNTWEYSSGKRIRANPESYDQFDTTPRVKDHLLLCYNRGQKFHRWYVIAELIKRNLLSRSFVSAYHTVDELDPYTIEDRVGAGLTEELYDILCEHKDIFPLKLSMKDFAEAGEKQYSPLGDDVAYFNNSYFSLITETLYYGKQLNGCGHIPSHFLTEKTFKVIATKHPFILLQWPGTLKSLRRMGYKTFHPYIDESYDVIEDDVLRLNAIMDEVERLSKYTDEQWLEFQHNIESILLHNFNVLQASKQQHLTFKDFI
jgi:hypothetical protein